MNLRNFHMGQGGGGGGGGIDSVQALHALISEVMQG